MRQYVLLLIFTISCFSLYSQSEQISISALIIDEKNGEPVPFAAVLFIKVNIGSYAAYDGKTLPLKLSKGNHDIKVSCIGYNSATTNITLMSDTTISISLQSNDININEVVVTATDSEGPVSASKINRKAIEHIQASSFTDVLQLLPGGKSQQPDLSKVNTISLRQAGSDNNTALGTAFILDGAPLSGNANMLAPNASSTDSKLGKRINVNNGIDMRQIPTDQIESIEVIQGIPSVIHGDLSSGAIIIKQRYGITNWEARFKTDASNKLLAVGKGLDLGPSLGTINLNGDYLIFNKDPRNPYEGYQRYTFSSRYFNNISLNNSTLALKANLSYTGSAEKDRNDPEIDDQANDIYRTNYNKFAYTIDAEWTFKNWFRQLKLVSNASFAQNELYRQKFISNGGPSPAPLSLEEGENYGIYLPATYEALYKMDDQPFNSFNQLIARMQVPTGKLINHVTAGLEWRYAKNFGKGEQYNLERPMYANFRGSYGISSRPRNLSSIPSSQVFSFFVEDKITLQLGDHQLDARAGVRASRLLNLSDKYLLKGQLYWEPRLNMQYTFPTISVGNQQLQLGVHGGAGLHYKFPTLNQLYPAPLYFDLVQLNYYSQNPELRSLHIKTTNVDPTNHQLEPGQNLKWEIGINLSINQHKLKATWFNETMENGFILQKQWLPQNYRQYSTDGLTPTSPPLVDELPFTEQNLLSLYEQSQNAAGVLKRGLEFQLWLSRFEVLQTQLTINGAWFKTAYRNHANVVYQPSTIINGAPYPYAGIYNFDKSTDKNRQQLNTNFQFDTQITHLGLVFTSTIECLWFASQQRQLNDGWPVAYVDVMGRQHPFTEQDKTDATLKQLYIGQQEEYFKRTTEPFGANLNIRVSKVFGKGHSLSFYVNNLLNHYPDYYNNFNIRIQRINTPYFGMELKINI